MARILITGASGFIGRHLVAHLAPHHDLYCLVREAPPVDGVRWAVHDLARPLNRAQLPSEVDTVVHLAQSRRYREFPDGARDIFDVNVRATFDLLEYARSAGVRRFLLASSGGVYQAGPAPLGEDAPISPANFYQSSKYAAELLMEGYQAHFHTIAARFFFVYGPGQHGMLMPTLLQRLIRGEPITIDGEPGRRINPIYVSDAVCAVAAALSLDRSAVINIAGSEVVSIGELVALMGQVAGRTPAVRHSPGAPGDLVADTRRMREMLGARPQVSLAEGLRAMLADEARQ